MREDTRYAEEVELFGRFFGYGKVEPAQERCEDSPESISEDRGVLKEMLYRRFQKEYLERQGKIEDNRRRLFFSSQKIFPLFMENTKQIVADLETNMWRSIDSFFREIQIEEHTEREAAFASKERKRSGRVNFSTWQRGELLLLYQETQRPGRTAKMRLGERIGLTYQQIEDWFSNKRKRELKKETLECFE
ncbi:MAG: uncharacterized protein A8A55_1987 [Amphiamblys sp. WSBS2006]|nr:MAG: uncharacterized protein A8A55_1987 [Amphiamblys sp. WSBS2006]